MMFYINGYHCSEYVDILPVDAITSLASDAISIGSISENELFVITIPPSV